MTTKVYSADPRQPGRTLETYNRNLKAVRSQSSPALAVVSNFDPDQRGFVTGALQGYTMVQQRIGVATTGRMPVHADYNRVPPGQKEPMRPEPGQPNLIYPVGSGSSGSGNLSFIKGGKIDYKRFYQAKLLTHNIREFFFGGDGPRVSKNTFGSTGGTVYTRADTQTDFLYALDNLTGGIEWSENSPLPPGLRYMELERMAATNFGGVPAGLNIGLILIGNDPTQPPRTLDELRLEYLTFPGDTYFTDYDSYLPRDTLGRIRINVITAPLNSFYHLDEVLNDDSYWTGEVQTDPLTWKDDYWDGLDRDPTGNSPRVDRAAMKTWLTAHPAAKINY